MVEGEDLADLLSYSLGNIRCLQPYIYSAFYLLVVERRRGLSILAVNLNIKFSLKAMTFLVLHVGKPPGGAL
jgi:hypothetical protein